MSVVRLALLFFILLFSRTAFAEGNCPDGYFPVGGGNAGWSGCAPIYNSDSAASYSSEPPNPGPRWQFRWGAIAVDPQRGKFAGIDAQLTPGKAKKQALKLCRKNGGKRCAVLIEYHNQCGALAAGDANHVGYYGPVTEEVEKRAMAACAELTSNCQIYYTGCSYPVEAD